MATKTIPVTERAAIQRINRLLAKDQQVLKKTRGVGAREEVGDYYIIDPYRNTLVKMRVPLEAFGRGIGALQEWERLEERP